MNNSSNLDIQEIDKFSSLASEWWDTRGPCEPLHVINPCRLQFILKNASLENAKLLDLGCGAGILSESLAKHGAIVTGIDASRELIDVAIEHAQVGNLKINYLHTTIEEFMHNNPQTFDIITCMELLEHVPNPEQLIDNCCYLLKPGGKLLLSTLNRTTKAYALAIIGAEYLLNILPKQTHDYKKFIRPAELASILRKSNMQLQDLSGINYQPFNKVASISKDVAVNYMLCAIKDT